MTARPYANYVYVTGVPFKLLVSVAIGAVFGLIGGLIGSVSRRERRPVADR